MKESEFDALVGSFLHDLLPPEIDQAFRFFAEMEYPCPDMKTFKTLISKGDGEELQYLASLFEPEDFAMVSVQNALEKFYKRARHLSLPGVPLPRASLTLLADVILSGGMAVKGTDIVFRLGRAGVGRPGLGAVEVDCECEGKGKCDIVVIGNTVTCDPGTCDKSCDLVVTIPGGGLIAA